jgi:Rad3-related DNA helicase
VQEKLIEAVRTAVANGENLLAEAPTGSGKTAAALHPALAAGLASGRQVVFLTSKTLQQKMAVSALVAMNERVFHTVQIRAKERMCANDRVLCHEDFCRFAAVLPGEDERVERARQASRTTSTPRSGRRLRGGAPRGGSAPSRFSSSSPSAPTRSSPTTTTSSNPPAALRHLAGEDLRDAILVVDEAHNLPDRARGIFSPEILEEELSILANRLRLQPGALFEDLLATVEALGEILREAAEDLPEGEAIAEIEPPREAILDLRAAWEPTLMRYMDWKRDTRLALVDDPVLEFHFLLQRFCAVLTLFDDDFTAVVERRSGGVALALVCLDPARMLAPTFRRASSNGVLSAHAHAARGDPARARPRGGAHPLDLAASRRSRREPARC